MQSRDLTDYVKEIVRRADGNRMRLQGPMLGQTRTLKAMIAAAEVVFGVYKSNPDPEGFNVMVIKGEALLDSPSPPERSAPVWDAIPCRSSSEAQAIKNVLGDLSCDVWGIRDQPRLIASS